jgi:hypothetical protein
MRRLSPTDPAARVLRQEVHFACPVCGHPILTYHHFDPPWREKEHNDPSGIIALCGPCHGDAEGGRWTKAELHELKKEAPTRETLRKNFPWRVQENQQIVHRLGGNYASKSSVILALNGRPVLTEERSLEGLLLFSLEIRDPNDEVQLEIVQNSLSVDTLGIWDIHLNTYGNHIEFRPHRGEIALDLRLSRYTLKEIEEQFWTDEMKAYSKMTASTIETITRYSGSIEDVARRGISMSMEYLSQQCLDSAGNIVVVDIDNATLNSGGRQLIIRNGMRVIDGRNNEFGSNKAWGSRISFNF